MRIPSGAIGLVMRPELIVAQLIRRIVKGAEFPEQGLLLLVKGNLIGDD